VKTEKLEEFIEPQIDLNIKSEIPKHPNSKRKRPRKHKKKAPE